MHTALMKIVWLIAMSFGHVYPLKLIDFIYQRVILSRDDAEKEESLPSISEGGLETFRIPFRG